MLFSNALFCQVGIGTTAPQATLDIRAVNHNGTVSTSDGVLVPRVNSLSVNGSVNGQLVYLIADAGSFTKGFHYWNGTAWTSLAGTSASSGDATNDAWVNDNSNAMIKLGTQSDGNTARSTGTEFVSKDDGSVGIGTGTPDVSAKLQVDATNKGFLPPRLNLTSNTMDLDGISGQIEGLMVYNTNTSVVNGLSGKGLYYWDGSVWNKAIYTSNGGNYVNFRIITGTYTPASPYVVKSDDYVLLLRYSTASTGSTASISSSYPYVNPNATLILPDPTTCPGRVLRLVNDSDRTAGGGQIVYTNYPMYDYDGGAEEDYIDAPTNALMWTVYTGINAAQWYIMSDGTRWVSLVVVIV